MTKVRSELKREMEHQRLMVPTNLSPGPNRVFQYCLSQQTFHFCFETFHSRLLSRWAALSEACKQRERGYLDVYPTTLESGEELTKMRSESQARKGAAMRHGRAVARKLDRFNEKTFQVFVPGSFRGTGCMSRPGTKFSISENISR